VTSLSRSGDAGTYLIAFGAALAGALVATPVARRLAIRFHILDHPDERKAHGEAVPYLGGLGIILAFLVATAVGAVVYGLDGGYRKLAVILGGALLLAAVGLRDDLRPVPGWVKAAVILPLAVALYAAGVRADPFDQWPLNFLLTVGWVAGIVNAVNFLDNMDGITAGVSAVAACYLAVLAGLQGQVAVGSLSAAVAGCALGFLWFNRPPARIFMGDMGSLFLGWLLAACALELEFENLRRVAFFVPIAILAVPIFDTLLISASRISRGHSPLRPGLDHTSHRLVALRIPRNVVVALHYAAALTSGWLGVTIAYASPRTAYFIMGALVLVGLFFAAELFRVKVDG
jgi:UDP-GlcNAc:undecaprenyl-phosphate GlcNAc-1-phosphate transferase